MRRRCIHRCVTRLYWLCNYFVYLPRRALFVADIYRKIIYRLLYFGEFVSVLSNGEGPPHCATIINVWFVAMIWTDWRLALCCMCRFKWNTLYSVYMYVLCMYLYIMLVLLIFFFLILFPNVSMLIVWKF